MATVNYNVATWNTGSWSKGNISNEYLYKKFASGIEASSNGEEITFDGLPATMQVTGSSTPESFNSVYFSTNNVSLYDCILYKYPDYWSGSTGSASMIAAFYGPSGVWAYGVNTGPNTGIYLTGAGNSNSSILDIKWAAINPINTGVILGNPFVGVLKTGASWKETIVNNCVSNYEVLDTNKIRLTNDVLSNPDGLRNVYVRFAIVNPV